MVRKISRLLGLGQGSKEDAKSRLKVLLIHDQVDLTPAQMAQMKQEILEVVAKYVEIDEHNVQFELNKGNTGVSLVSSVPVRRVTERPSPA